MKPYDVAAIRARFPSLANTLPDGRPIAFLDGPAGTQVPQAVIDAYSDFFLRANANNGGLFSTSRAQGEVEEAAHRAAEDLLNAPMESVKFGANMSTLNFQLSRSLARELQAGDEVIVTQLDHDANYSPWRLLAEDHGLVLKTIRLNAADGTLDMEHYASLLGPRTKIVATGMSSNALGTINPTKRIVEAAHAVGALTVLDAVCSAPHYPVDVQALDTDFLLCSPYKFYGPHAGLLYGKLPLLERFGRYKVRPAHDLWETGTPAFEAMAGVTAAINHIAWIGAEFGDPADHAPLSGRRGQLRAGLKAITRHETELVRLLLDGVDQISGVQVRGITDRARLNERTSIVSFTMDFATPDEAAEHLGNDGIQVWSGDFYAPNAIDALGLTEKGGVLRTGLMSYNTADEVQRLLASLKALASLKSLAASKS
jgi:cysteine desulfurase family protein (TIGR01976 family)